MFEGGSRDLLLLGQVINYSHLAAKSSVSQGHLICER